MTASAIYLNGATLMSTTTDRLLTIALDVGYAGIEARAERLLEADEEVEATAALTQPGQIFSLNGISLSMRGDGRMDRAVLESDLRSRLAICERIRAQYLLAVAPRAKGLTASDAMPAMRDALRIVADGAARSAIRVAFEFLGFPDCPINTPTLAGELVDEVREVEVVLDSCHWHASGGGPLSEYPVDRLALVHLNDVATMPPSEIEDADRVLPGEGAIRLAPLVAELAVRGYSGPWSVETFNPSYWQANPDEVARRALTAVRRLVQSS